MTLRWYYALDASTVQEWTDRVRLPVDPEGEAIGVGKHAEAGSGWEGDILVDDPSGTLPRPKIHRRVYAVQDAAPAGAQVVGNWFISGVKVRRMDPFSGAARRYVVTMADESSLLSRRKWTGADANRPAETDIARIRWALLETELNVLSPDETYIDTSDPIDLEASDLRDHSPEEMLMTMFQRTKKEHWVKYEEAAAVGGAIVSSSVANPTVITTTSAHGLFTGQQVTIAGHAGSTPSINATHTVTVTGATTFTIPVNVTVGGTGGTTSTVGRYVLCYFNPNTSDLLPSTISISNDPADSIISGDNPTSLVYPLHDDAELDGTGGRLSSGLIVPHLGASKRVYVQDTDVGDAYAYVDNVATPPIPIKTEAEATAYATTELAELATPDDEVTTTLTITGARMNLVTAGMIVPVHATHYPNYTEDSSEPGWESGFVTCRVKRRLITQLGPETFEMPLTLSPMTVELEPSFFTSVSQGGCEIGTWLSPPPDDHLLVSYLCQRDSSTYDATIVPIGVDATPFNETCSDVAIAGTEWTFMDNLSIDNGAGQGARLTMAYRQSEPSEPQVVQWGGDVSVPLSGAARPRSHYIAFPDLSGAPTVTAKGAGTNSGTAFYTSPDITVAAAGYIFAGFAYRASFFTGSMVVRAPAVHVTDGLAYGGYPFDPYSWFGYLHVASAGTYNIVLDRTNTVNSVYAKGWVMGFWPE